jgi:hypothetical protein
MGDFRIVAPPVYVPGHPMPVRIQGSAGSLKGIHLSVTPGGDKSNRVGSFQFNPGMFRPIPCEGGYTASAEDPNSVITHVSKEHKDLNQIEFYWTPLQNYGPVDIQMVVMGLEKQNWQILSAHIQAGQGPPGQVYHGQSSGNILAKISSSIFSLF